jgi:hypothetical protein
MTTPTFTKTDLVAVGTSNSAGSTLRGRVDATGYLGGTLTVKITNGATPPTVQCVANVLSAHAAGTMPAAGAAGADWKTRTSWGGGVVANAAPEWSIEFGPTPFIEVEFTGNTGQSVTVEAIFTGWTA